jgi:D-tyrosyl-tRNA(Tyr) deacylase
MRLLIQRVSKAKVTVSGEVTGEITRGLLVFLGVGHEDTEQLAQQMAEKTLKLRIFENAEGKMDLDVTQIAGSVLVVSQFTLYGDAAKGNRPSFSKAARPEEAKRLYDIYCDSLRKLLGEKRVAEGRFAAMMDVELVNDGPVTIWLDT